MGSIGKLFRKDETGGDPVPVVFDLTIHQISGWDDPDFAGNNVGNVFILVSADLNLDLEIVIVSESGDFRITGIQP